MREQLNFHSSTFGQVNVLERSCCDIVSFELRQVVQIYSVVLATFSG